MYYAYAINREGEVVAQAEGQNGGKIVMSLFRTLRNDATKRTGWIYDLTEIDEATEHTLDVYISARPYSGDFAEWLAEDTDLLGPVLLKPSEHCAAWQRHLRRCEGEIWRTAFSDDEIFEAELNTECEHVH